MKKFPNPKKLLKIILSFLLFSLKISLQNTVSVLGYANINYNGERARKNLFMSKQWKRADANTNTAKEKNHA